MKRTFATLLSLIALASCVAPPAPPAPALPPPAPPPPSPAPPAKLEDAVLTPGTWIYTPNASSFGRPGAPADLILRCDPAARAILIERPGATAAAAIAIDTSYGSAVYPAQSLSSHPALVATVRVTDPFLDKIAYSRGRFQVKADGLPVLTLPSWAEVARVIEDCRA